MAAIKSYSDLEQSRKLAKILPLESADMLWEQHFAEPYVTIKPWTTRGKSIGGHCLPCWSLTALLGVIKKYGLIDLRFLSSTFDGRGEHLMNVWCCTFDNINTVSFDIYADNPLDACYELILKLHELNLL